jgi:hypothetical protein
MRSIGMIAVALCVVVLSAESTNAQAVFEPGDGIALAVADNCATASEGPVWVPRTTRCDAPSATAGAEFHVGSFNDVGNPRAAAALFNTFRVTETPETSGRYVGAWIGFDVAWKGALDSASIGLSQASVEVTYELTDLTAGRTIMSDLIYGKSTDGFAFGIGPIPVEIDFGVNQGVANSGLPAILVRGHVYRFLIRLTCSGRLRGETGGVTCDYSNPDAGYGITWQRLQVKLGADDRQISDRLTRLETEIELLKRHTHEYLTGVGVGHNNTAAESGPPILPASPSPAPTVPPAPSVPAAPVGLTPVVHGSVVRLSWMAGPSGAAPSHYVLEVGSAPGLRDLIPGSDVGPETSFAASGVPAGTYYVRVRAANAQGLGAASSEVTVRVR